MQPPHFSLTAIGGTQPRRLAIPAQAMIALEALYERRSATLGLFGNSLSVATGRWLSPKEATVPQVGGSHEARRHETP